MSDSDAAWIDAALSSARPQTVGALLRYFRDLGAANPGGAYEIRPVGLFAPGKVPA